MKTSPHPSSNGPPRHFRESRFFRRILKSQHATADASSVSSKFPRTYCTGSAALNCMSLAAQKMSADQTMTGVETASPPPYHAPQSRFVASLGTTVLTHIPPIHHSAYEPFSLDDIHLAGSTSTKRLLDIAHPLTHTLLRRTSSADSLFPYQPARPSTPCRRPSPLTTFPTRTSSSGSDFVQPATPSKQALRRKDFPSLVAAGVMSPIHEEPELARIRNNSAASLPLQQSERQPLSILRRTDSSDSVSSTRTGKKVRFEDEGAVDRLSKGRLFLFPTVVASLLLLLAISEMIDGVRLDYVIAFVVGCGVAHGGSAAVVGTVEETLSKARAEGWA